MLKVLVIAQQNLGQYWQETFTSVWEGQIEVILQKEYVEKLDIDLVVLDFSGCEFNAHEYLASVAQNLIGKHFLIVTAVKDADLAIEALRLGAVGFLVKPFKRSDFLTCLDRMHTTPKAQAPTRRIARIIAFLSYKGGTGVSTTVVNVGYALSKFYNKKTLIIDAAGFSNHINVLLNVIPKCNLADICKQGDNLDEHYLGNAVSAVIKNLDVIGGLNKTTEVNDVTIQALEHLIDMASEIYDFILIDTSTHLIDEATMFFIQKANDLLLLTTFDLLAIRDNRFYLSILKELGVSDNKIKPIINRQDWYIGSLEPALVQKQLNHSVYHSLPNDWQLCVEAANYGRPVSEVSPNAQLSTSYKILAGKIARQEVPEHVSEDGEKESAQEDKKAKKKSLLGWFEN